MVGLSVTLAARIGDLCEPGQVLVSDVVRQLLLSKGFAFTSVGSAELKGLGEPVPLFEVRPD
jgi:class 3 adenylate cyclase